MLISGRTPMAKAILWVFTDVEVRKRGDQRGLDTPVVHAVNDDLSMDAKIDGGFLFLIGSTLHFSVCIS